MSNTLNLAGQLYGDLYVLSEAEPVYGSRGNRISRWLVSCLDCAESVTIVRQTDLRSGRTTRRCACGKKAAGRARRKDGVIGYQGAHNRAKVVHGHPSGHECSHRDCDEPAEQWAYSHGCPDQIFDEKGRPYCTCEDAKHFLPICRRHHTLFDHERTKVAPKGTLSLAHVAFGLMRGAQ